MPHCQIKSSAEFNWELIGILQVNSDNLVGGLIIACLVKFCVERKGKAEESSFLKNVKACDMPNSKRPIDCGDEIYTITRPKLISVFCVLIRAFKLNFYSVILLIFT